LHWNNFRDLFDAFRQRQFAYKYLWLRNGLWFIPLFDWDMPHCCHCVFEQEKIQTVNCLISWPLAAFRNRNYTTTSEVLRNVHIFWEVAGVGKDPAFFQLQIQNGASQ